MWFSSIAFDPDDRRTRALLSNPQRLHAAVMRSCGDTGNNPGRVLWRLDHKPETLFVVSPAAPDLDQLTAQCGPETKARTTSYDRFLDNLAPGSQWRFRVTINPVRSLKSVDCDRNKRGKRVALLATSSIEEWLIERSAKAGFAISELEGERVVAVTGKQWLDFIKGPDRLRVRVAMAQLEGLLEVADADALRKTLTSGIGRARGYGCGLLTLARLR